LPDLQRFTSICIYFQNFYHFIVKQQEDKSVEMHFQEILVTLRESIGAAPSPLTVFEFALFRPLSFLYHLLILFSSLLFKFIYNRLNIAFLKEIFSEKILDALL